VSDDEVVEGSIVRRHPGQVFDSGEQEVRLPLQLGKCAQEGEDVPVLRYPKGELLVPR